MSKIDPARAWSNLYRLLSTLIQGVAPEVESLGLEIKELFLLAEVDEFPNPAALAGRCSMPKPTVTMYLKKLEAAGYVKREIDAGDLRRHKISLTPSGRKIMTRGIAMLSEAFGGRLVRLSASEQATFATLLDKLS